MGSPPGDHAGANAGAARAMQLKVLMPSSSARCASQTSSRRTYWAARALAATAARLPRRAFGKVWDVEVGRDDGDGSAFLGRGWPEFAAAHGLGVGWFVVLRHEGGGVVTVKVLDTTNCLKEFATPPAVVATRRGRARDASHKPQFVRVLLPGFMEKMTIPDKFVQHHITEEHLNSNMANILSPLGKFWRIELEKDDSGMFFKGGWLQFLSFHGISPGDVVLLRHEGNLAFKIKVFGPNGCKKDFKTKDIRIQQNTGNQHEAPSFSWMKCNQKNRRCGEHNENQHCSRKVSSKKMSGRVTKRQKRAESIYGIGPSSWIKKMISKYMLERAFLSLSGIFCKSIGLVDESTITLETSRGSSRRSWEVPAHVKKNGHGGCYLVGAGWKRFCHDNGLKVGDVCTFNVVEANLWHVFIERS